MYQSPTPRRSNKKRRFSKKLVVPLIIVASLTIAGAALWWFVIRNDQTVGNDPITRYENKTQGDESQKSEVKIFDKTQFSLDDPTSPWVVANKQRPLNPIDYAPNDLTVPNVPLKYEAGAMETELRAEAATALQELFASAKAAGQPLIFVSGYRSHNYQASLFNHYVNTQGLETALNQSARPGHSEHQTGWAADVGAQSRECEIEACFGDMPEGQWVASNAYKFGFIVRYPQGLTGTTGYDYEPWHLRYVGKALAAEMQHSGTLTMEDFFNLPAAPEY
jgi:zinc D-Ala-D-Ala carboxypeptidase